jgi:preprotein translocase subunit YajC
MDSSAATQIGFLLIFIFIMYFLLIRPQRKKEKAINEMRNSLQVGDEIITIGGICGKIVKTRPESLIIQVGVDKIKFEVMRWGISRVTEQSKPKKSRYEEEYNDDDDESEDRKKILPRKMKKPESKSDADDIDADDSQDKDDK